jgi:hypothetical protein
MLSDCKRSKLASICLAMEVSCPPCSKCATTPRWRARLRSPRAMCSSHRFNPSRSHWWSMRQVDSPVNQWLRRMTDIIDKIQIRPLGSETGQRRRAYENRTGSRGRADSEGSETVRAFGAVRQRSHVADGVADRAQHAAVSGGQRLGKFLDEIRFGQGYRRIRIAYIDASLLTWN